MIECAPVLTVVILKKVLDRSMAFCCCPIEKSKNVLQYDRTRPEELFPAITHEGSVQDPEILLKIEKNRLAPKVLLDQIAPKIPNVQFFMQETFY